MISRIGFHSLFTVIVILCLFRISVSATKLEGDSNAKGHHVVAALVNEMEPKNTDLMQQMQASAKMAFKCPKSLNFAFECRCFFARIGLLKLESFQKPLCRRRAKEIRNRSALGKKIAKGCRLFKDIKTNFTTENRLARLDEIFQQCPSTRSLLCPKNEDKSFKIIECGCYLEFNGILKNGVREGLCDTLTDFSTLGRKELRKFDIRCRQVRLFKDFFGSFLGLIGRNCIFFNDENCCNALPPPPSPPIASSPAP